MGCNESERAMSASDFTNGPTWYAETVVAAPDRSSLVYDLDVDVCVIGAGLAGLTVAREVARRGWSVSVLEAGHIAGSASGRNGGMVLPGFAEEPERIIERVGLERAKTLWALSLDGLDYVRNAIEDTAMPGVEPVDGGIYVQRAEGIERAERAAALLGETFGTEVEVWDIDQVRDVLKTERYFQALHFPDAFHIHPLNYALGLAAAAEADGARIFEHTRALAIDPAGVRKRIDTTGARVRAHHVVMAGSAQLAPLFPLVADAMMPVVTSLAVTAPLGDRLRAAVGYAGAVVDTRGVPGYFRIVGGDRLMWGYSVASRGGAPDRIGREMRRDIRRVFPQLGDVEISHAWSGVMGYAMHKMPLIGEVSPGLWVATAFGGHGLNTTAMAGDLVARAIMDGDDRWRLFSSYDLVWAGGRAGLAARRAMFWISQAHDWLDETITRRRHASRMRWERISAGVADEAKRNVAAEATRIAAERVGRRHAEAARLVAEEAGRRVAAEAARVAALDAERQAAEAARFAAQEAERLAKAHEAEQAAVEAERRVAEELRVAAEQAGQQAAEVPSGLVAEEAERSAQVAELAAVETDRQIDAEAARRAAEDAERAAADAARLAADETARLAETHAARIAAKDAERQAVAEETAALITAETIEKVAGKKRARKSSGASPRKTKKGPAASAVGEDDASQSSGAPGNDGDKPVRRTRKRTVRVPPRPAIVDTGPPPVPIEQTPTTVEVGVMTAEKPRRRRGKPQA